MARDYTRIKSKVWCLVNLQSSGVYMDGRLQEQLSEIVEKMPAFPASVNRVIELSSDINCNHKYLVAAIEHDPVMTLKVIKLVNSPYFGLAREITSINHAVVYVGLNTVKNLALSIASIGMLPHENEAGLNMDQFLYHSLSTASLARFLAKHMGVLDTDKEAGDYFVAGLLHDFGKIVFAQFMPLKYKQVLYNVKWKSQFIVDAEKEIIGIDHTQVGVLLGEKWKLPSVLLEGIESHHSAKLNDNESISLLAKAVFVANKLSIELTESSKIKSFSEELINEIAAILGADLNKRIGSPKELREEVKKSLHFMHI